MLCAPKGDGFQEMQQLPPPLRASNSSINDQFERLSTSIAS